MRPFSLPHQELLAKRLFEVRPSYEGLSRRGYASTIAERLGAPLLAVSAGPTAADKRFVRRRVTSSRPAAISDGA